MKRIHTLLLPMIGCLILIALGCNNNCDEANPDLTDDLSIFDPNQSALVGIDFDLRNETINSTDPGTPCGTLPADPSDTQLKMDYSSDGGTTWISVPDSCFLGFWTQPTIPAGSLALDIMTVCFADTGLYIITAAADQTFKVVERDETNNDDDYDTGVSNKQQPNSFNHLQLKVTGIPTGEFTDVKITRNRPVILLGAE